MKQFAISEFVTHPDKPSLSINPSEESVQSEAQVEMTCTTSSSGSATYTFFKDFEEIFTGQSGSFTIDSASTLDSGFYSCVASIDGVSSVSSDKHRLNVTGGGLCSLTETVSVKALLPKWQK